MKILGAVLAAGLLGGCSRVETASVATGSAIDALLNAHEAAHADKAAWVKLGPAARVQLLEIIADPTEGNSRRARAAEALGFIARDHDADTLRALAVDKAQHRIVRMGAVTGLSLALSPQSAPAIIPFLDDDESGVRARAIDLLAHLGTDEALAALASRERTASEGERARIANALQLRAKGDRR